MSDFGEALTTFCLFVCMLCTHFRLNHIERLIKERR